MSYLHSELTESWTVTSLRVSNFISVALQLRLNMQQLTAFIPAAPAVAVRFVYLLSHHSRGGIENVVAFMSVPVSCYSERTGRKT